MGVPFKKIARKDPRKSDAVQKYYPQLVTLGANASLDDIAYVMKEKSSLTLGDIQSVLTNFVEAMIATSTTGNRSTSRISEYSACQPVRQAWKT